MTQSIARNITIVPAQPRAAIHRAAARIEIAKPRVCAYCRVSTDLDEQLESYEAQMNYYTNFIMNKPNWEFAGIYADEGISGTSVKKRVEFLRMIDRCMAGEIDMIVTKSISRFARNTLDCLNFVRRLREKGITVLFEKENIDTGDAKGELLLTILSSLAQDESRNISENTRWGIQQRFREGRVWVGGNMLGYKSAHGRITIDEMQAATVKRIFGEYLSGKSTTLIARELMEDGVLTGAGKSKWTIKGILTILKNEKYTGDALMQKTYTADFLTHKQAANNGELPMVYIEGSHDAIITKEVFERTQMELKRRARGERPAHRSAKYPFSTRVICMHCSSCFTRRIWDADDPRYKRAVWQCASKISRARANCASCHITEKRLVSIVNTVMKRIYDNRSQAIHILSARIENMLAPFDAQRREHALKLIDALNKPFDFARGAHAPDEAKRAGKRRRGELCAPLPPDCHFPYEDMPERLFRLTTEKLHIYNERHIDFIMKDGSILTYHE